MRQEAKTGLWSGTEAEGGSWPAVWNWELTRAFAAVVDVLSDIHNTFVFSANFQGR